MQKTILKTLRSFWPFSESVKWEKIIPDFKSSIKVAVNEIIATNIFTVYKKQSELQ